jgi:hypothetical protein
MKARLNALRGQEAVEEPNPAVVFLRKQVELGAWLGGSALIGAKEQERMIALLTGAEFAHKSHLPIYVTAKTVMLIICRSCSGP